MSLTTSDKPTSNSVNKKTAFRKNILTLAVVQALTCGSSAVYAANITVNDTADNVPSVITDGKCTLREAILSANTDSAVDTCTAGDPTATASDTINFDPTLSGSTVTLGGTELSITNSLTIDGDINNDGTADITVDGNNTSRAFYLKPASPASMPVIFDGLTITKGYSNSYNGGGAIFSYSTNSGSITLINSTVSNNKSKRGYGGGINTYKDVILTNSTISGNQAIKGAAGGLYSEKGSITLTNSTVSGNTSATNYSAGGIWAKYGAITLNNSTVSGNTSSSDGGGIKSTYGNITLNNSTVSANTSSANGGGGVYSKYGLITLNNSTVSGNTSKRKGGGIYAYNGSVTLGSSTVSGNTSGDTTNQASGGGIYAYLGKVTLRNSTVSGNTASYLGGGIYAGMGDLSLINSTIVDNAATYNSGGSVTVNDGGGIFSSKPTSTVNIVNSILANNTGGDCKARTTITTNTNNLIKDGGTGCGSTAITPALTADPQLAALADNGGPTKTHLPAAGSPVINAGDNTSCGTGLTIATDQRGAPRDDGSCDIGAVEGSLSLLTPASVQLDSTTATISENGGTITLNLTRSGNTASGISVDYNTADGTAIAPGDYTADANTLNFATGVTSQSITIAITDDSVAESDETFTLTLSNVQLVSGSAPVALGANTATTVTITDDDTATTTTTAASSSSNSNALGLSPWWSLLTLTGWLRRRFKS